MNFRLIFDSSNGIALQYGDWAHYTYAGESLKNVALDILEILKGNDPDATNDDRAHDIDPTAKGNIVVDLMGKDLCITIQELATLGGVPCELALALDEVR